MPLQIEKAIKELFGKLNTEVTYEEKKVTVSFDDSKIADQFIRFAQLIGMSEAEEYQSSNEERVTYGTLANLSKSTKRYPVVFALNTGLPQFIKAMQAHQATVNHIANGNDIGSAPINNAGSNSAVHSGFGAGAHGLAGSHAEQQSAAHAIQPSDFISAAKEDRKDRKRGKRRSRSGTGLRAA